LKIVWNVSFGPAYERLFRRWFRAMVSRQDTTLGHIGALQVEVAELRRAVAAELARSEALRLQVRDLDVQVRNALAARWDDAALTRRMVALEDRLQEREEPLATAEAAASDQVSARPAR
jgi:BMFP domain-containing protein YqiC